MTFRVHFALVVFLFFSNKSEYQTPCRTRTAVEIRCLNNNQTWKYHYLWLFGTKDADNIHRLFSSRNTCAEEQPFWKIERLHTPAETCTYVGAGEKICHQKAARTTRYILQGSPSGCVWREIAGVTKFERNHEGSTAVVTACVGGNREHGRLYCSKKLQHSYTS